MKVPLLFISTTIFWSVAARSPPNIRKDIPWTRNINARLCQPGNHPDWVARDFYSCYQDPRRVPGGDVFIQCQKQVFGTLMNTKAGVDAVCAQGNKLSQYAFCTFIRLPHRGVRPTTAIHMLNECQGAVLGVPSP